MLTAFGLAGLILFVLPPRLWESASVPMYVIVCALLVLVIFVSKDVKGSHSWFELGPVKFQPAEISKITTSLLLASVMGRQNFKITQWKDFLLAAAIIAVPMLIIVAESETGSALVYAGFIFVLYREGFSGGWLGLLGLVILLFITTLTISPYTSILILIGILTLCNAFMGPRKEFWKRLGIGVGFVALMAVLPWLWGMLQGAVQDHLDWMERVAWVPTARESQTYRWAFLLKIKPLYILLGLSLLLLPFLGIRAFRGKDGFLGLSLAAFIVGVVLVFSTDFIFQNVLQDHQRSRIEVLLGMKEDLAGVGYNVNQSKIAIGSGGLTGKGFLQGTQTAFGFVPEPSTDFIFCTVGEEWGFFGCTLLIVLYVILLQRLIVMAERQRSSFARVYGYSVASILFIHLFVNVGMVLGLVPVIGIPLPFFSYGGSSLLAFTILLFIFIRQDASKNQLL
jgi:rod shape determining protein RodA